MARGLAVLGMVLVNFDLALGSQVGPVWVGRLVESVQGRASALFVVLAGIGIQLLSRSRGSMIRATLTRRGVALLGLGLLLLPLWPADILHFYGAWFLLAIPCLGWRPRALGAFAVLVILLFPALLVAGIDYERHWNFETLEYTGLLSLDGMVRHLTINGFHPTVPWFAFVLMGMAVAERLLDRSRSPIPLAWAFGALALAAKLIGDSLVEGLDPEIAPLLGTDSMPPGPLYMLSAGSTALAITSLCVAWGRAQAAGHGAGVHGVARVLAATGRAALTLYVAHVLTGVIPPYLFYEAAAGPGWSRPAVTAWWLIWSGVGMGYAAHLARASRAGPLERAFRRVTR